MSADRSVDYYEILQVSANAEQETIQRLYRVLAQRFHPDNRETGNEQRFRELSEAYSVLNDPARRARYDVQYHEVRKDRWRLLAAGDNAQDDFAIERMFRLTLLEVLYSRRRIEPYSPTLYASDIEGMVGRSREELEFTIWYLLQRRFITRDDQSRLMITAEGVDYLEQNYREGTTGRRQLPEHRKTRSDAA